MTWPGTAAASACSASSTARTATRAARSRRLGAAIRAFTAQAVPAGLGLLYTVVIGTVLGGGIWTTLLRRHPSSAVAPFSMLVPVTAMSAAWLVLGEVPAPAELAGGVLVVLGVLLPALPVLWIRSGPTRRPPHRRRRRR